jgi:hypothetical protein
MENLTNFNFKNCLKFLMRIQTRPKILSYLSDEVKFNLVKKFLTVFFEDFLDNLVVNFETLYPKNQIL